MATTPITHQELDELRSLVISDTANLRKSLESTPGEDALRTATAILRRFTVDEKPIIQKLWKATGHSGEIAVTWEDMGPAPVNGVAVSAKISRPGISVSHVSISTDNTSDADVAQLYKELVLDRQTPPAPRPLSSWLSSECVVVNQVPATRRDVIKFVANKLGAVHFDFDRRNETPGYRTLNTMLGPDTVRYDELNAVYAQVESIARELLASSDFQELVP